MSESRRSSSGSRHAAAVSNSFRMADAAAQDGDHRAALGWLEAVRATGETLPEEYEHKRG